MIKRDFVPKSTEQFNHSSQENDLGYEKYLVLLIWEQRILIITNMKITKLKIWDFSNEMKTKVGLISQIQIVKQKNQEQEHDTCETRI